MIGRTDMGKIRVSSFTTVMYGVPSSACCIFGKCMAVLRKHEKTGFSKNS